MKEQNERVNELLREKQSLAAKVLEGDTKAKKRVDAIDAEIRDLTQRAELEELARREEEHLAAEQRRTEERERIAAARKKYREYGEEWKKHAGKAQELVSELRETLDGLMDLDQDQRNAGHEAGERLSFIGADVVIRSWLRAHLGDGYVPTPPADLRYGEPLADLAPLPESIDPPTEEEARVRDAAIAEDRAASDLRASLLIQRDAATAAAFEVVSPAVSDVPPENLRVPGVRQEIHNRTAEAVLAAGPDLPRAVADEIARDAMRWGFGEYGSPGDPGYRGDLEEVV